MKKADPYVDSVLGEWKLEKTKDKSKFVYKRSAKLKLHKDNAQDWTDPETFEVKKVHGDVVLTETKLIDKETSRIDMFRELELTEGSIVIEPIP